MDYRQCQVVFLEAISHNSIYSTHTLEQKTQKGRYMNSNQSSEEMSLEDFIALPDTIPLIIRNTTLRSEYFRQAHNIRKGTALNGDYYIGYVDRKEMNSITAEIGPDILRVRPIVLGLLGKQSLDASGITRVQQQPYLNLRGGGTLIGLIDTGIDYTKDSFKYDDKISKIKYIWDQSNAGDAPSGFHFGAEYSQEQINNALRLDVPFNAVPHQDTVGHGTFLASIAAGASQGTYAGAAPEAEIIAVKLKKAAPYFYEHFLIPKWQENAYTSSDLMLGIQYILNKAEELDRPVAICISVGSNMGGHDGLSVLEEYLTRISVVNGVAITCAAGNESQAGHHIYGKLSGNGDVQSIELFVGNQPNDIYLTLWNGASDRMSVSITSPTGELIPRVPVRLGSSHNTNLVLEKSRVKVEYYLPIGSSGDQYTGIRIFHPTPGIWTIHVHGDIILNGAYHSWLPMTGFIDAQTAFLAPIPDYTVVTPATSIGIITCGAYNSLNNSLSTYSSRGPTRLPIIAPDLVAPGVDVGGLFPTGYGRMSGTSVSAAITAGACALMLQWGVVNGNDTALSTNRIQANLIRGCMRDPSMEYPNTYSGYGRLNLYNTLNTIRS